MVVGVAGKYCAGKSTVAQMLAEAGYRVIDVDRLGHEALARRGEDVRRVFGGDYVDEEGSVDRGRLGRLVFRDRTALRRLESIVHPEMVEMVRERLRTSQQPTVINAALLFPMGLDTLCDTVLWVTAPALTRICRARRRDGLPLGDIVRRFWAQRSLGPQYSAGDVDIHTVENRGDLGGLRAQLVRLALL
ncbi:MAG: dephospho-CoA kinase [Spirochaetaceae bacterium]